ncbi:hypothetical protein [uncultured Lutibacter sp.]|uniref:hypothetical protein n=1 Tax=uncultured Lutibacter sp. TaxID=437739 RepID=UPI0026362C5C|nr:hypothetical protein [uncultured Lutibacter sp.]
MIAIKTVEYILIAIIGFLVLFNIYLNFNKIENDTINVILKNWAYNKYFFITFIWGVLGGHFFLGTKSPLFGSNWWIPVVLVIVIVFILILIGKKFKSDFVLQQRYQLVLLITGLLYGHYIWSQRHIPEVVFPWGS